MKRIFLVLILTLGLLVGCTKTQTLPKPEITSGMRGEQLGIDKNINETTLDQYLNREDVIYRDMRMLKDEANYEAIGGDSYLSGYVEGFEVVPYPYLVNVSGLPEEVGSGYQGPTLFTQNGDTYEANYEESLDIIKTLFPKDKTIFLMCGGGGYAGMMKKMLVSLGWDENKIYNVGGYWYYEGDHAIQIKREENGETYYDFYKVPYHQIDFDTLHALNEASTTPKETSEPVIDETVNISLDEINTHIQNKETFALYFYLPGCNSCASFQPVIKEYKEKNLVDIYQVNLNDVKEAFAAYVTYTPSIILYKDGEVNSLLLADKDEDTKYYQDVESLSTWFHEHLGTEIVTGSATNEDENGGCSVQSSCD